MPDKLVKVNLLLCGVFGHIGDLRMEHGLVDILVDSALAEACADRGLRVLIESVEVVWLERLVGD